MSDKSYAETQGEASFDWRYALSNPEKFNQIDLSILSAQWVTCACGNQCAIIPREGPCGVSGMPIDSQLYNLGGYFHAFVTFREYGKALDILDKIEARSAILIREELAKLNAA